MAYCDALCRKQHWATRIPGLLRKDFETFASIDRAFSMVTQVDELSLAESLGPALFRAHTRVFRWLRVHLEIASVDPIDREWALLPWKLKQLQVGRHAPWISDALRAFTEDVIQERKRLVQKGHRRTRAPLRARSAYQNVRAAMDFLVATKRTGVSEMTAINQTHLDRYAASKPGDLKELGRFIRYLNRRTARFKKLKLIRRSRQSSIGQPLTADAFDHLVSRMLAPSTHSELRYMLMTLFCLLFAQYPHKVVALRQDQVRRREDQWEFRPAKIWLDVPEPMASLLTRWQESRREQTKMDATGSSLFLFPGLRSSDWFSVGSFNVWLARHAVRSRRVFASGFANLCRHGLQFASTARDAYGVNPATACRYLAEFHPMRARTAANAATDSVSATRRRRSR